MSGKLDVGTLVWALQTGLLLLLGALLLFIVTRLLSGAIKLDGLLVHDQAENNGVPERMALALATLGYALFYLLNGLTTPLDPQHPSLPDVPEGILTALFGVNGLYLTSKVADLRRKKRSRI